MVCLLVTQTCEFYASSSSASVWFYSKWYWSLNPRFPIVRLERDYKNFLPILKLTATRFLVCVRTILPRRPIDRAFSLSFLCQLQREFGVEKKISAVKRFIQPFLNRSSGWYFCWLLKYITSHNLEKVPKQRQAFLLNLDTSLGLTLQLILNNWQNIYFAQYRKG